jgi:predicted neutral ceramidase superfamily lipid hydrolase
MFNIWPYLLRLAVALYFIYPHAQALAQGVKKAKMALFECINQSIQIPESITFTIWHSFFVILGVLILLWPRPILPLVVVLLILSSQLYINFSMMNYTSTNMLLFILILVTLALIIYHSRPQFR